MHAASVFSENLQAECFLGFVLHCFSFVIAEVMISNKNLLILSVLQKPVNNKDFLVVVRNKRVLILVVETLLLSSAT